MAMPRQLARAHRPRPGKSTRPIVEQLRSIKITHLPVPSYYDTKTYVMPNIAFRLPQIASAKISFNRVEFQHPSLHRRQEGPKQTFEIKHIRTGIGKHNGTGIRHAFICSSCGEAVITLYYFHRKLACRYCFKARYASQTLNKSTRPVLEATRIQSFLDNKPRLFHRTQERLRKKLGDKLMMAQSRLKTRATGLWE